MSWSDQWIRAVMSGQARGAGASLLRGTLSIIEPAYRGAAALRNRLFDGSVLSAHRLPRPVISVGNLTTGGTGKTPAVVWLARRLRQANDWRVAILLRGYKPSGADADTVSDEEMMLRDALPDALVIGNPDRAGSAVRALQGGERIDAFVLDDGFQHRKLHRDFDLVLLDATNPFGYGHVLPRGMLRESPAGLIRADAALITRADLADAPALAETHATAQRAQPGLPVYQATHRLGPVRMSGREEPIETLKGRRVLAMAGIGNPAAFEQSLTAIGVQVSARRWFADHHDYTEADVKSVLDEALTSGVQQVVTTHKDRVKLQKLATAEPLFAGSGVPLAYVDVSIAFQDDHEQRLFEQIQQKLAGISFTSSSL